MTDSLSPLEANQSKHSFVSPSQSLARQNLDFTPSADAGLSLQINLGDMIVVKAEDIVDSGLTKRMRHRVVGRSLEGDLVVIQDARRKCGNGLDFKYILNFSALRELTVKEKKYLTDGEDVFQRMPGLHNFRLCPELRVLRSSEVLLA